MSGKEAVYLSVVAPAFNEEEIIELFNPAAERMFGYPAEAVLVCGMALGYEEKGAVVNSYRTEREPVEAFTRFFD